MLVPVESEEVLEALEDLAFSQKRANQILQIAADGARRAGVLVRPTINLNLNGFHLKDGIWMQEQTK